MRTAVACSHMQEQAAALADAVEAALPRWVVRSVERVLVAYRGATDADVMRAAAEAGQRAGVEVGAEVRVLLSEDIDE